MKNNYREQYLLLLDDLSNTCYPTNYFESIPYQVSGDKPVQGELVTGEYKSSFSLKFEFSIDTNNCLHFCGGDPNVQTNKKTVKLVKLAISRATKLQYIDLCISEVEKSCWDLTIRFKMENYCNQSDEKRISALLDCLCGLSYLGWRTDIHSECGSLDTISLGHYKIICTLTDTYEAYWSDDGLFAKYDLPYPEITDSKGSSSGGFGWI